MAKKAIIIADNEIPVRVDINRDYEDRLVAGDLTSNGVQYTAEAVTTTADADVTAFTKTVDPDIQGDLLWVELGLTAEFKCNASSTGDIIFKWQARNKDGAWVDLHAAVTLANVGTTYAAYTRAGYFAPVTNFNRAPFDLRLLFQCNESNEGRCRVKNSSYARAVFKVV
jgi:hypothetical protein